MKTLVDKIRNTTKSRKEQGFTLLETVLYIAVLAVLVAGAVSLISNVTDSSTRFTTTTATQADVNRAQAIIQRDIGLATEVTQAGGTHLQFNTKQDNTKFLVTIFSYNGPGTFNTLPEYIKEQLNDANLTGQLPDAAAVVEIRKDLNSGKAGLDVLTKGYDPLGYTDPTSTSTDKFLFSYYNDKNVLLALDSSATFEDELSAKNIKRIEFRIAADAPGRASKIQAESSVSPLLDKVTPSVNSDSVVADAPLVCPPNFGATITVGERAAFIKWNQVQNATSYILKRYNTSTGTKIYEGEVYIADPSTTSYSEAANTLAWGSSYVYTITVSSSGSTLPECSETPPQQVVPASVDFRNINAHANLGVNKSGGGTETLSGVTVDSITRTASTANISANLRYTVARDLTNQLAWQGVYGATHYDIYRVTGTTKTLATSVAATQANTAYSWQDARSYGDSVTYAVNARNSAGSGANTPNVVLISPPNGSSVYTAVADDPNTTLSVNRLLLDSAAPNVVGYTTYANTTYEANCAVTGGEVRTPALDFSQTAGFFTGTKEITHNSVQWGSSTCYQMVPFNDAGSYDATLTPKAKADQAPKRFNVSNVTSSLYYSVDYKRGLPASTSGTPASCWVSADGTTSQHQCNGAAPLSNGNRYPVGAIEPIPNGMGAGLYGQPLRTSVRWASSEGARAGYDVKRVVTNQGAGTITGFPLNNTTTLAYANASSVAVNGVQFNNEKPGTAYDITVSAKAKNGKTRTPSNNAGSFTSTGTDALTVSFAASNTFAMQTRPDMPSFQSGRYQQRTTAPTNRFIWTLNAAAYGQSSNIYSQTRVRNDSDEWCSGIQWTGTVKELSFTSGDHASYEYGVGCNFRTAKTRLNSASSGALESVSTAKAGRLYNGYCVPNYAPCGANFADYYNEFPNYWAGMNTRAYASTNLTQANYPWSSGQLISGQTVPTSSEPSLGGIDAGADRTCDAINENEANFTVLYDCTYGTGIPPAPNNLTYVTSGSSNFITSWDAVPGATSYIVSVDNGSAVTTYTTTNPTYTVSIPSGSTYKVNVKAVNPVKTGPATSDINLTNSYLPATPTNLKATAIANSNSFNITWTAVSGATSYKVTVLQGSTTNTYTVTTPTYKLVGAYGKTYTVSVKALEGTLEGNAAQINATGVYVLTAPTGLAVERIAAMNRYNITWNATEGAQSYIVQTYNGATLTSTKTATANTTTLDVVFNSNTTVRVTAVVSGENTPQTAGVAIPGLYAPSPSNLLSAIQPDKSYNLQWDAITGVDRYDIIIYDSSNNIVSVTPTTSTTANVVAPTYGQFNVKVRGVKSDVNGAESTNVTISSSAIGVPTPTVTRDSITSNNYTMTWSKISNATSYDVIILNENSAPAFEFTATPTTANYKFTVPAGQTWTALIRANIGTDKGNLSAPESAVGSYLPAPTNMKVARTGTTANYVVTWDSPVPGNTNVSYNVAVTTEAGAAVSSYNTAQAQATVTITDTTKYNVKVTSVYAGTVGQSATILISPSTTPASPTGVTATVVGTNVKLAGTPASTGLISFIVKDNLGAVLHESAAPVASGQELIPLANFEGGIAYTLEAYTVNTVGGARSLPTTVAINLGKLGTPKNVVLSHNLATGSAPYFLNASWTPVANATEYFWYIKNASGTVIISKTVTTPSFSIDIATELAGKDYLGQTLTLEMIATSTNISVRQSNVATASVVTPSGVNNLKLTNNYDIDLKYPVTWDAVPGATSYTVSVARSGMSTLSYVVTGTVMDSYVFTEGMPHTITVKPNNGTSASITETIENTSGSMTIDDTIAIDGGQGTLGLQNFVGSVASASLDTSTWEIDRGASSRYTTAWSNPTFTIHNPEASTMLIILFNGKFVGGAATGAETLEKDKITDISFGMDSTTNANYLFNNYSVLERIVFSGEGKFKPTSMIQTFAGASSFNQPLTNWDTSNVTNMSNAFADTLEFNQPLTSWDTSKVTNMSSMFIRATAFDSSLAGWNTSKVTTMASMFNNASAFNQSLAHFNTANVVTMTSMFSGATSFNSSLNGWDTGKVTSMSAMFNGASSFNQPLVHFNTANVADLGNMFNGAAAFNQSLAGWNTSKVTGMISVFNGAKMFNQPLTGWDTSMAINMSSMFNGASAFNQPLAHFNTAKSTNMASMFQNATVFNQPIATFNTANVTTMTSMFNGAKAFNQSLAGWDTSKVTVMSAMFTGASSFNQLLTGWNTANVTTMVNMFSGATVFNQPVAHFSTVKVTTMSGMFNGATAFDKPLTGWNTSLVTNMSSMFNGAAAFNQIVSHFDTANVTTMASMFQGAKKFNQPLAPWAGKVTKVTSIASMFSGATVFNQNLSSLNFTSATFASTNYKSSATAWTASTSWPKRNGVTIP